MEAPQLPHTSAVQEQKERRTKTEKYAIALVKVKTGGRFPTPKAGLNITCVGTLDSGKTINMETTTTRKTQSQDTIQIHPIIKIKNTK